jgi:hypothetical protein
MVHRYKVWVNNIRIEDFANPGTIDTIENAKEHCLRKVIAHEIKMKGRP